MFSPYLSFLFLDALHGRGENHIDEDSSSNSDSDHINQFGSGSKQNKFIEKIASLVSQKLQPPIATTEWQNYNLNPPNSTILATTNSTPTLKFENVLTANKNDKFDQKRLLKFVPSNFKEKARQLLEHIEQNPEQLNFSTDGIIYINKTSIPNSDIFHLFPYLFKARRPKALDGFEDFLSQIDEMGLTHLIKNPSSKSTITKTQKVEMSTASAPNWWYLGP